MTIFLRAIIGAAFLALPYCAASAQSTPVAPAFEVASVKPAAPVDRARLRTAGTRSDPGRVTYPYVTFGMLLTRAYNVRPYQISGPDWLATERFDVTAKIPDGATADQVPLMLQTLLAERFKLSLRREKREMSVYALVPAKTGPKLHAATDDKAEFHIMLGSMQGLKGNLTMAGLANALLLDRPVIDMTGIPGTFAIDLKWQPEDPVRIRSGVSPDERSPAAELSPDPAAASIFTILQEKLGLKLEPRKSPVEILIIDRAEKVPTGN